MAVHPCPRCRKMIPVGQSYCPECADAVHAERERLRQELDSKKRRAYDRERDKQVKAFRRSEPWKRTSRAMLTAVGYRCEARLEGCTGLAVEVHHVKPLSTPEGWERRLDWSNLEAVCTNCHNRRHPEKGVSRYGVTECVVDIRAVTPGGGSESFGSAGEITGTEACRAEKSPYTAETDHAPHAEETNNGEKR